MGREYRGAYVKHRVYVGSCGGFECSMYSVWCMRVRETECLRSSSSGAEVDGEK